MRGAAMSLKAAVSGLVIFLLSVSVVKGEDTWGVTHPSAQICAVKGSTVEIPCAYTYPSTIRQQTTVVQSRFWFTKERYDGPEDVRSDPDYSGRVEYLFNESVCTLRITDLRERDSTVYKFMFTTNQPGERFTGEGVTLSVTDLQVQVERVRNQAELKCYSRCKVADNPSYVWYRNGQKMTEETSSIRVSLYDQKYSCCVKGHEDYRSPAVYAPKRPSVSVSPSAEIVEGSSVTLTCSSDANPAATFKWYKRNQTPQNLHEGAQLVLSYIQPSNSGEYYCEAENELGRTRSQHVSINVKYAPKLPSVSVSPSAEIVEGSSVTLTCSSDANPAATFKWYKRNLTPQNLPEGAQLVSSYIQPSNSGEYYCEAENELGRTRSQRVSINVKYAPTVCSATVSPAGEIRENSRVTVTCSCDGFPPPEYTWYKQYGREVSKTSELVFSSVQSSDSGRYYCTAKNDLGERRSGYADVKVKYAPKRPSVSVRPSAEIVEGRSVTLTCSSDANPAATYTWFKKNNNRPLSSGAQLVIWSIKSSDSGEFYCKAENKLGEKTSTWISIDVKYAPKRPSVSVRPSAEIVEGSSVTLTCSSDANPAAKYTWYKQTNYRPLSREAQLVFRFIKSSDSGEFYCKAENKLGEKTSTWISIDVKYPPKLPSVSVSPSAEIVEGSSVTLTCSSDANPAAKYTWFKEDEDSPTASGQIFTINNTSPEHTQRNICCRDDISSLFHTGMRGAAMSLKAAVSGLVIFLLSVSVVKGEDTWGVTHPSAQICAVKGSTVEIPCAYTYPSTIRQQTTVVQSRFWFTKERYDGPEDVRSDPDYSGRVEYLFNESVCTLRITDLRERDSTVYKFMFTTNQPGGRFTGEGVTLSVTDLQVQVERVRNQAELKCYSRCKVADNPSYVWYRNGQKMAKETSSIRVSLYDQKYSCCVKGHEDYRSPEVYAPKLPSVSVSPSAEIVEGSSVTLTCSSDANPAATFKWYKRNQTPQNLHEGAQLVLSYIQPSNSGEYYCEAENELGRTRSQRVSINVKYAPTVCSATVSPAGEIRENRRVTVTCSCDGFPPPEYT
ncbi:B-cell receptor CD22-like, partial [Tautogolabrus adspersus]